MTRCWLVTPDERTVALGFAYPGAGIPDAAEPCECGATAVVGNGASPSETEYDEYVADGFCGACKAPRGVIHAQVDTIFGVKEDDAVLSARCRVYG